MATGTTTKSDGFEWRILLGPTHNWPLPAAVSHPPAKTRKCCGMLRIVRTTGGRWPPIYHQLRRRRRDAYRLLREGTWRSEAPDQARELAA